MYPAKKTQDGRLISLHTEGNTVHTGYNSCMQKILRKSSRIRFYGKLNMIPKSKTFPNPINQIRKLFREKRGGRSASDKDGINGFVCFAAPYFRFPDNACDVFALFLF